MNAEAIRAEAIERIARDSYEHWRVIFNGLDGDEPPALPWDEAAVDYGPKQAYWNQASAAVDALGDLLPTAVEGRYIGRGMLRRTRYVGDWKDPDGFA